MSYPVTFIPFDWSDLPSEASAFDKANAQEAEKRLAKFVEEYKVYWRAPVKKESELPKVSVATNDIFFVEETKEFVVYNGAEYVKPNFSIPFWKSPFTKESELPIGGNTIGDVRLVKETNQFYICVATIGTVTEQWHIFEITPHHWLAPVKKESELPITSNVVGDVRFVTELKEFFICFATAGTVKEQWEPFGHVHTTETLTWIVAEKISSGIIPGPFRQLATSETQTLVGIEVELGKGKGANAIEYSVERYDAEGTKEWKAIASLEKLKLQKEELKAVTGLSVVLHTKDRLRLNILSVTEQAEGLALSAFVEHVARVA